MTRCDRLLSLIRSSSDTAEALASFGFDVHRAPPGARWRSVSGRGLEAVAGEFTGGTYLWCPEESGRRAVVFAGSEGEGGLIAGDLASALETVIGLEWQDVLTFSGGGDAETMRVSAGHLERRLRRDRPEIDRERAHLAAALGLRVVPRADLAARLRDAVARTGPDHTPLDDDGLPCDTLFGGYTEPRAGGWP
jgi:hypothetical protein